MCVVCLQGCKTTVDNNKIHVSIVDSVFFTLANPTATVECGADYTAKLTFRYGYEFDGCDYADYAVTADASGKNSAYVTQRHPSVASYGHVLTGRNTLPDGSGDHVGPGSRVTVANGGQITLYAEWAKSLDRDDLLYIVRGDEIVLTG